MLVAVDPAGGRIIASRSDRDDEALCPVCQEALIYKRGRVMVPHWAHRPAADCHHGEGESREHMAMKEMIHQSLTGAGCEVQMEVAYPSRRADLQVTTPNGNDFIIECQASAIAVAEMESRTMDYNNLGLPVTWVWWHKRVKWDKPGVDGEAAFPKEMLALADGHPWSTVYIAEEGQGPGDHQGVSVWANVLGEPSVRHSEWTDEYGDTQERTYLPKTFRYVIDERPAIFPGCVPTFRRSSVWSWTLMDSIDIRHKPERVAA